MREFWTMNVDPTSPSISTRAVEQGAKHDAGPWAVCTNPPNPQWYADQTIFSASQGTRVADLCTLSAAYEANGRLIAAAPDMLAALQQIVAYCDGGADPAIPDVARAAIAKATGSPHLEQRASTDEQRGTVDGNSPK